MIDVRRVTYRYPGGQVPALSDFDWRAAAGEFVLITGPSGCGKSTLLRCLNGLIPHFHGGRFGGQVLVAGVDTRATRPGELSRVVGFVAQDPETQTVMDRVEDEIAFGPENHRLPRAEMRRRVQEALQTFGIAALRDRELVTLSGGERQRVVIAAAMAMQPPVLVLDEPTSQLDPWGAEDVMTALERLPSEYGTTIILVEHRLDRVMDHAGRMLVLGPGATVVADGAPATAARALADPPPLVELAAALGEHAGANRADDRGSPSNGRTDREDTPGSSAPGPAVEAEYVTYTYRGRAALDSVDLRFPAGRITAVMGRNGSGKTTLLKLLNGLLRPQTGGIRILGDDIAGQSVRGVSRAVAYAPQNPSAMLFNDSVTAELGFTLRALASHGDIAATLGTFGLQAHAARSPLDLSTGERQRVALAAVLVAPRPVVLLDEPTRGMDEARKRDLGAYLRGLARSGGTAIVATHDVEFAARAADRVVILDRGRVVTEGSTRAVLTGGFGITTQVHRAFGGGCLVPEDVVARARLARHRDATRADR